MQLSDVSQTPLPQAAAHWVPHWVHSATHSSSQEVWQQNGSCAQTQASQSHPPQPGSFRGWHPSHEPQSIGQDEQLSFIHGSHWPLPQFGHQPQSCGQVVHVSPSHGSHS